MSATVDYRSAILDEEHRGKGLGRATMQAAEDYVMSLDLVCSADPE